MTRALLLTPEPCPWDVNDDGYIDEDDAAEMLAMMPSEQPVPCPQATICRWDVNFDCEIFTDDVRAVLDHIAECNEEPCPCPGSESLGGSGGGLSASQFLEAMMAQQLTEAQMLMGWEQFFAASQ